MQLEASVPVFKAKEGIMPWNLDKSRGVFKKWDILVATEMAIWDKFQNAIAHEHIHPALAAERLGTIAHKPRADYKQLRGDQYQIRLSGNHRATFRVIEAPRDKTSGTVQVLEVGGHT